MDSAIVKNVKRIVGRIYAVRTQVLGERTQVNECTYNITSSLQTASSRVFIFVGVRGWKLCTNRKGVIRT
jgi:hypothetical protein